MFYYSLLSIGLHEFNFFKQPQSFLVGSGSFESLGDMSYDSHHGDDLIDDFGHHDLQSHDGGNTSVTSSSTATRSMSSTSTSKSNKRQRRLDQANGVRHKDVQGGAFVQEPIPLINSLSPAQSGQFGQAGQRGQGRRNRGGNGGGVNPTPIVPQLQRQQPQRQPQRQRQRGTGGQARIQPNVQNGNRRGGGTQRRQN